MIKNLLSFLQNSYSRDSDNQSYAVIMKVLQMSVPTVPNLVMALILSAKTKPEIITEDERSGILDHRICNLCVKFLRKLHAPSGTNEYVGVSFEQSIRKKSANRQSTDDYEPVSCLVLGANGVGKTSLFCALEIAALGSSNIARNHGYETMEQQQKFLTYSNGSHNPTVRLCTKAGIFETTVEKSGNILRSLYLPQAFFCSSFDISRLERGRIGSDYMMHEMGRLEFLLMTDILKSTRAVLNLLEEYSVVNELLLDENKDSKDESSLQERRGKFEKQIKEALRVKRLPKSILCLKSQYLKKLGAEIDKIISVLESEVQRIFEILFNVSKRIIPNILGDFLEDCVLDISMAEGAPSISLSVRNDADGSRISLEPRQFFNTFRLKLFAIALKISLSCCVKIIDKVNFPFIIDDTFDASDFISKSEIKNFIGKILYNHNLIRDLDSYPLQLIIFTQDDIIAQKAYHGLDNYVSSEEPKPMFLKLYDCTQAEDSDYIKTEVNEAEISYYNIADKVIG